MEWFLCPDGFGVVQFAQGDGVKVTVADAVIADDLVWLPVVGGGVVPLCDVGTTEAWVLYEEGVTVTLEVDIRRTLDAWTEVSPVVVVVVAVVGLVPLSEATTEISESFTHCSKRPFLLKVNSWVSYKTDYWHLQQKQNDRWRVINQQTSFINGNHWNCYLLYFHPFGNHTCQSH